MTTPAERPDGLRPAKPAAQVLERAVAFLHDLDRPDLAYLLSHCAYDVVDDEVWFNVTTRVLELRAPAPICDAIRYLPPPDQQRLIEAVSHGTGVSPRSGEMPRELRAREHPDAPLAASDALVALLIAERGELIDVATKGTRINDVNDYFKARRRRVASLLAARGIADPIHFADLWQWYETWRAELPSYAERRAYVDARYAPAIGAALALHAHTPAPAEPTGWERADRALVKARETLVSASEEEDFQAVGLLCREALISAAQAVFDATRHRTPDGVTPSATDAARMIEAFVAAEASGGPNEEIRAHAKASLKMAVALQHRRTAEFRTAALCYEGTSSVIEILAILSGRRDRAV